MPTLDLFATPTCGIYTIVCKKTGKEYIGSSKDIPKRWKKHKWELSRGFHHSSKLQRAWGKYGASEFEFIVIKGSHQDELLTLEQSYIESRKPAFNMASVAGTCTGVKRTVEQRKVMSDRMKALSDEDRAKRVAKMRKTMATAEFKNKRSEASKRAHRDPIFRDAMLCRMAKMHANEDYKLALAEGRRKSFLRPETRAAMKAAAANRGAGTNWYTKHKEGLRAYRSVPDETVRTILRLRTESVGATEISNRTGVKLSSVKNIIHGNSYKDVSL